MLQGKIFDIKRFAIHDGPGIRTTIFFKGCNMKCLWCHNPEGLDESNDIFYYEEKCIRCGDCITACPEDALVMNNKAMIDRKKCSTCGACVEVCPTESLTRAGRDVHLQALMDTIKRSKIFYETSGGGVTISGGEPLFHFDFVKELAKKCKEENIHVALDTAGHIQPKRFNKIIKYFDLFLYDLKIIDEDEHIKYTGVTNRYVIQNLKELSEQGRGGDVWIRFPMIPGITYTESNIEEMIGFLSGLNSIKDFYILPFHDVEEKYKKLGRPYSLSSRDIRAPTKREIRKMKDKFSKAGFRVHIGG